MEVREAEQDAEYENRSIVDAHAKKREIESGSARPSSLLHTNAHALGADLGLTKGDADVRRTWFFR